MKLYAKYQEAYGWTIAEIDDTDMAVLLDQMCVMAISDKTDLAYIDDVI